MEGTRTVYSMYPSVVHNPNCGVKVVVEMGRWCSEDWWKHNKQYLCRTCRTSSSCFISGRVNALSAYCSCPLFHTSTDPERPENKKLKRNRQKHSVSTQEINSFLEITYREFHIGWEETVKCYDVTVLVWSCNLVIHTAASDDNTHTSFPYKS